MDLWIDPDAVNVRWANAALAEFGSPALMDLDHGDEILQIGIAPDRIDLLRQLGDASFEEAWRDKVSSHYGSAPAHWISAKSLLSIKVAIHEPRHQDDARVLREVIALAQVRRDREG